MIYKNLNDLFEQYDSFLIDVYGVLYNGSNFFDGTLDLLKKMKYHKKRLIILSNTTLIGDVCKKRYFAKGLIENVHYDEFLSSGEAFKQTSKNYLQNSKNYFEIFENGSEVFEGSDFKKVDSIDKADFVYVGYLNVEKFYTVDNLKTKFGNDIAIEDMFKTDIHDINGFEKIAETLDLCLKFDKTLVVVNPDIFALELVGNSKRPVLCQGAAGEFYERMGGKVLYFGKPYPTIYDFGKKYLDGCQKTAMIGDTLWTDILGGNMAGVDTILTLTGVSGQFFKNMPTDLSVEEKMKKLMSEISSKMTHKDLLGFSQEPNYIIESFA